MTESEAIHALLDICLTTDPARAHVMMDVATHCEMISIRVYDYGWKASGGDPDLTTHCYYQSTETPFRPAHPVLESVIAHLANIDMSCNAQKKKQISGVAELRAAADKLEKEMK